MSEVLRIEFAGEGGGSPKTLRERAEGSGGKGTSDEVRELVRAVQDIMARVPGGNLMMRAGAGLEQMLGGGKTADAMTPLVANLLRAAPVVAAIGAAASATMAIVSYKNAEAAINIRLGAAQFEAATSMQRLVGDSNRLLQLQATRAKDAAMPFGLGNLARELDGRDVRDAEQEAIIKQRSAIDKMAQQIGTFSPQVAQALAQQNVADMQQKINVANAFGPSAARMVTQQTNLSQLQQTEQLLKQFEKFGETMVQTRKDAAQAQKNIDNLLAQLAEKEKGLVAKIESDRTDPETKEMAREQLAHLRALRQIAERRQGNEPAKMLRGMLRNSFSIDALQPQGELNDMPGAVGDNPRAAQQNPFEV